MKFERAFSGAPWEKVVGYCRAVRAGDHIYVTGTVAVDDEGKPFAPSDGYAPAHRERFADHPPATTMVEVKALIAPESLIEIEADAVVPSPK